MREAIFNNFWGLGDNSLQRQFAASHKELKEVQGGENIG